MGFFLFPFLDRAKAKLFRRQMAEMAYEGLIP
jgi:hypothetical protein